MAEEETLTTTIEVNKDLFLKFKAFCVLKETTLSGEIEKMIRKWVDTNAEKSDMIQASEKSDKSDSE